MRAATKAPPRASFIQRVRDRSAFGRCYASDSHPLLIFHSLSSLHIMICIWHQMWTSHRFSRLIWTIADGCGQQLYRGLESFPLRHMPPIAPYGAMAPRNIALPRIGAESGQLHAAARYLRQSNSDGPFGEGCSNRLTLVILCYSAPSICCARNSAARSSA